MAWSRPRGSSHWELPFVLDSGRGLPANGEQRLSLPGRCGTLKPSPAPQSQALELQPCPQARLREVQTPPAPSCAPETVSSVAACGLVPCRAHQELLFVMSSGWGLPANGERRPSLPVGAGPWGFPLGLGVIAGGLSRAVVTCFHHRSAGECTLLPLVCGDAMGESAGREPLAGTRLSGGQGLGVREFSPISTSSRGEVHPPSNV